MTKFFVLTLILLVVVVGFVIYKAGKNPQKAEENTNTLLTESTKTLEDIATPPASEDVRGASASSTRQTVKTWPTPPALTIDQNKTYTATITTSKGTMTFELYAAEDPVTVNNFVFLSKNRFYDGIIFHRIIKDFMIQGGDPTGTGAGGPGYKFDDEKVTRDYTRGTLAMANSGPNTNGSQFFIMTADTPLPKLYTIFGKLTAGDDVLQKIAETPTVLGGDGAMSKPTEKVTINSIDCHPGP